MGRFPALSAALALALAACEPAEPRATASRAVVTLPAVPGGAGAGYFELESNRDEAALARIETARAQRIELHETMSTGGTSTMRLLPSPVPFEGRRLHFAPGRRHAMVFGLDPRLRPGDRIALTFVLTGAPSVTAQAEVRSPGDVGHAH